MKGILMKPDMIQAAVEGRKSNTRRAEAGLREINREPDNWILYDLHSEKGTVSHTGKPNEKGQFVFWQAPGFHDAPDGSYKYIKPRYHIGETVYIKEAYWVDYLFPDKPTPETRYIHYRLGHDDTPNTRTVSEDIARLGLWQNPLFMPEWAARHFLKITDVRAERLQEITEEDAIAEGFRVSPGLTSGGSVGLMSAVACFREPWNSINPKYPWESNPWLFPYTFQLSGEREQR